MSTPARLPVSYTRPTFEVDGEAQVRLDQDLLHLEVTHDEEGMARLEGCFLNWGRVSDTSVPDFMYFDGQVLGLGRELVVTAGDNDEEAEIFSGIITAITGRFPEGRPPEVLVFAEDAIQALRMGQRTRLHEERSDAEIAQAVFDEVGLRGEADVEGPTHVQLLQAAQSDLAFLRERARAVDARLLIDADGVLRFRPRREDEGQDAIQLSRLDALLHFSVSADLAHQRSELRVHGWSVSDKEPIHESAGSSEVQAESVGGKTGVDVLADLGWNAVEDHHLEAPSTVDEARRLAESLMRRRARRFVTGQGVTDGTPAMRPGSKLELLDLGPWFSGIYHATTVRHTYDQDLGLRTRFTAERVDFGGEG